MSDCEPDGMVRFEVRLFETSRERVEILKDDEPWEIEAGSRVAIGLPRDDHALTAILREHLIQAEISRSTGLHGTARVARIQEYWHTHGGFYSRHKAYGGADGLTLLSHACDRTVRVLDGRLPADPGRDWSAMRGVLDGCMAQAVEQQLAREAEEVRQWQRQRRVPDTIQDLLRGT